MGKPDTGNAVSARAEYIGARQASEGTETSQYLEERKSTETPRVVASERGRAQTRQVQARRRCLPGVVGRPASGLRPRAGVRKPCASRSVWNVAPQRATVP